MDEPVDGPMGGPSVLGSLSFDVLASIERVVTYDCSRWLLQNELMLGSSMSFRGQAEVAAIAGSRAAVERGRRRA